MHTLFFRKGCVLNESGFEVFITLVGFLAYKDVTNDSSAQVF